jgi:hypothetical protein
LLACLMGVDLALSKLWMISLDSALCSWRRCRRTASADALVKSAILLETAVLSGLIVRHIYLVCDECSSVELSSPVACDESDDAFSKRRMLASYTIPLMPDYVLRNTSRRQHDLLGGSRDVNMPP